jgi:hypothetical protein
MHRCLKILVSAVAAAAMLAFNLHNIQAAEFRHHEAHEHGVAHLNVALEGNDLYVEFISPAANIVGFEHHPHTEAQKSTVSKAVQTLKAGETLFVLAPGAESSLVTATVNTDIEDHAEHESDSTHVHDQVESGQDAESEKHGHHEEHHEADEHGRHSDFRAEYHFVCQQPKKLAHVVVMLFSKFPGIEHIEVQLLTASKQTALKLTAADNKISF